MILQVLLILFIYYLMEYILAFKILAEGTSTLRQE